ncbi:L,D-transpeptidase family protein [Coriobacterium glomerans]|uniref:L,D-transpeptidase family protein n=1 Tax=Coriobacterium glomerans TaxID=33871 RepID=UPI00030E89A0|nr:L,D-transpeptidase family protein [Coriobacterium glomerans]
MQALLPEPRDRRTTGGAHAARSGARGRLGCGSGRRGGKIALLLVLSFIALVYVGGIAAFSLVFYPNTSIAGADVSLLPEDGAATRIDSMANRYSLTVEGIGFKWSYAPKHGSDLIDANAAAKRALAGNEPYLWPVRLWRACTGAQADAGTSTDRSLLSPSFDEDSFSSDLKQAIDTFNEHRSGAFDTQSAFDPTSGAFSAERARGNEKLSESTVERLAKEALSSLRERVSLETNAYEPLKGGVSDGDLQRACDAANALIGTSVTFKLAGTEAGALDGETLSKWITFDDALSPALDNDKVSSWAHELADTMNTVGSERTYTRPDGKVITVSDGTYGWKVDEKKLVEIVQDAVHTKRSGEIDVPTTSEGVTYAAHGNPDWGAYADVDISEQRARYFDASGKLLWETGIVTGKPNGEDDTPTGIYKVNKKLRNITLVSGKIDPNTGKPVYESPVQYWIAFVDGSIGFHDASWQSASVYSDPGAYRWAGSHGCINTPLDKVIELYDMIQVGDAVIVHN